MVATPIILLIEKLMEYEFIHDSLTGSASARFSMEHEIMGPWLEVEVSNDISKLTVLLEAIANLKKRQQQDILITGIEYTLTFSEDSVKVASNSHFENIVQDERLLEEGLSSDQNNETECGIEDFKELLIKWSNFIK